MAIEKTSLLGRLYRIAYEVLCGKHPEPYPWHFQWLDTFYLARHLRSTLPHLSGRVLDVGCGRKPYRALFAQASDYIGLDVVPGGADIVVKTDAAWPLPNDAFDVVFSTQVIEHVENLSHTLREISRVCKPGGRIVLSFPFLYNEHGTPFDYQRFTVHGAARLLDFDVEVLSAQGGYGSTVVGMTLNWLNDSLNLNKLTRLVKALILPIWIPFCLLMNVIGLLLDRLDRTNRFYSNVFIVFVKAKTVG